MVHDSKDIQVVAPMEFMSTLLCISRQAPHRKTCPERTRFDVWAHHPYSNGGPNWHAHGADDASIGDLPEMRALLAAAERAGRQALAPRLRPVRGHMRGAELWPGMAAPAAGACA